MPDFPSGVVVLPIGSKTFHLDRQAVAELQQVKQGDVPNAIFIRFAPHIAIKYRLAVWQAIDSVTL